MITLTTLTTSLGNVAFGLSKGWTDDYYKIRTTEDLIEFAQKVNEGEVNAKGKLFNNIEFKSKPDSDSESNSENWTPIGTTTMPFQGELISNGEGKQYKIINLCINGNKSEHQGVVNNMIDSYKGLFGYIGEKGRVSNISVESTKEFLKITGQYFVGGIAGYNEGTIRNCNSYIDIEGNSYVGGLVGFNKGSLTKGYFGENKISGQNNVGGIVGYNEGTIESCENIGFVRGLNNIKEYKETSLEESVGNNIGGIVGWNKGDLFGEFKNEGDVTGKKNVGGNVGLNEKDINEYTTFENKGMIMGEENIGGNIGYNKKNAQCIFNNSGHVGTILGSCIGGNVGLNEGIIRDNQCQLYVNKSDITVKNTGPVSGKIGVGGNIGANKGTVESKIYNEGNIQGEQFTGGNLGLNTKAISYGNRNFYKDQNEDYKNIGNVNGKEATGGNIGKNEGKIDGEFYNSGPIIGEIGTTGGNLGVGNEPIGNNKFENSGTINGESADTATKIGNQK